MTAFNVSRNAVLVICCVESGMNLSLFTTCSQQSKHSIEINCFAAHILTCGKTRCEQNQRCLKHPNMKSSTTTVLLSVAAFAVFAVAFATAAAPPSTCDPRYECSFRYVDSTNKVYAFDFSTLCAEQDYILADKNGRIYHANICGNAHEACIPEDWSVNFNHGVAVQSWGPKPSCDKKRCFAAGSAQPVCCTRDCQVCALYNMLCHAPHGPHAALNHANYDLLLYLHTPHAGSWHIRAHVLSVRPQQPWQWRCHHSPPRCRSQPV